MMRLFSGFIACAGFAVTQQALACSDLPNICEMNAQHHQQMQEYARDAAEAYYWQQQEEMEYRSQRYYDNEPTQYHDPTQIRLTVATGVADIMSTNASKMEELKKDPRYQTYLNGGWEFFQDTRQPKAGEYCAALYWKKDSMVRVSGPGGEYRGALLTFWGPDIPKPAKQQMLKVALYQNDEAPQEVKAFNYLLPGYEYGAIAVAVPTLDALLSNMEDKIRFELKVAGKSVAKVDWHDGLLARDKLRQCTLAKK